MLKKSQKTGKITKKRAKNRQFSKNARLNGHARFKTGDFGTLPYHLFKDYIICEQPLTAGSISKDYLDLGPKNRSCSRFFDQANNNIFSRFRTVHRGGYPFYFDSMNN